MAVLPLRTLPWLLAGCAPLAAQTPALWSGPEVPRSAAIQASHRWYRCALADAARLDRPEDLCRCGPPCGAALPPPHWLAQAGARRLPRRTLVVQVRPFQRCARHSRRVLFR